MKFDELLNMALDKRRLAINALLRDEKQTARKFLEAGRKHLAQAVTKSKTMEAKKVLAKERKFYEAICQRIEDKEWDDKETAWLGNYGMSRELYDTIVKKPSGYQSFMFYGHNGNHKGTLIRNLAEGIDDVEPVQINPRQASEEDIRHMLARAYRSLVENDYSAILVDSLEQLAPESCLSMREDTLREFKDLIADVKQNNVILLATADRPWAINESVEGALDLTARVFVPLPEHAERLKIFKESLGMFDEEIPFCGLAKATYGYSRAQVEDVCDLAKRLYLKAISDEEEDPRIVHKIKEAIKESIPVVKSDEDSQLREYSLRS